MDFMSTDILQVPQLLPPASCAYVQRLIKPDDKYDTVKSAFRMIKFSRRHSPNPNPGRRTHSTYIQTNYVW